jgi:hypothetical protein
MTIKVALEFLVVSFQTYVLIFAPLVVIIFVIFEEYSLSLDPEYDVYVTRWSVAATRQRCVGTSCRTSERAQRRARELCLLVE